MSKKPDWMQLPYGLSWAQWERFPGNVQDAIRNAQQDEHLGRLSDAHAWWDIVERLEHE